MYEEKEQYRQLCDSLYHDGVIKQDIDGAIIAVDDPSERESIKSKSKQKIQQQLDQLLQHLQLAMKKMQIQVLTLHLELIQRVIMKSLDQMLY